jgi:NAD(P)-dependent dehydrogenase (short-subunit alcohol dehydrogenase family)
MTAQKTRGAVLVTGAEGALGREAVVGFARFGVKVVASARTDMDRQSLEDFFATQGIKGVKVFSADLTVEDDVARLIALADDPLHGGPVSWLFHCAGAFKWVPTVQATAQDFDLLIGSNLRSSWLVAKHLTPRLVKRNYGRLVFVSAKSTKGDGEVGMGLYNAAKAGLNAMIESLAKELRPYNVNVNALMPTIIDTPANRKDMPDRDHTAWVTPMSLVNLAATLMSESGDQINGSLIAVPGRV